jgi:hypothetical protein
MSMGQRLILELIQLASMVFAMILVRWMLELSSPRADWYWFKNLDLWYHFKRLKWYRGPEYMHQLKFQQLLRGTE